jgi:2-haloacid dehalogenase
VLLFDVFGTLVDWRSSLIDEARAAAPDAAPAGGWPALIDDWRRAYQPAMDRLRAAGGEWRDLDSLQRETLDAVLAAHDVQLSAVARSGLVGGWRRLRPWPDSRPGLDRLRRRHLTATLSNGHLPLLADLLKSADLRIDVVLSAQLAGSYKPDPSVYLTALRLLGCPPGEAAMVAAHASDLRAAAALGLRPVFVARPDEWGAEVPAEQPPRLDGLAAYGSVADLAAGLGC